MDLKAIAVVDENWGIGKEGKLLAHLPGDLQFFKEKTLGKTIVMGRGTLDSLSGRPLPGRETVLLSKNYEVKAPCPVCHSLEELFDFLQARNAEDVFIAGGELVYRQLLPFCKTVFITKIHKTFDADKHFPNLDKCPEMFELVWSGEQREENGFCYHFCEYQRKCR